MRKIFENMPSEELGRIVGEPVESKVLLMNTSSSVCIVNDRYIVKAPTSRSMAFSLQQEINIAKVLQKSSLPAQTPDWKYVELNRSVVASLPKWGSFCAVAPVIKGVHPTTLDSSGLMADLGRFLASLHKIRAEAFAGVLTYMDADFNYMVDLWEKQKRHKGVEKDKWRRFKSCLKNTVLRRTNEIYIQNIRPILTHADLHVRNVLVDKKGRLTGVLDFGNASLTSEAQDILIATHGCMNKNALLNAYQGYMGQRIDEQDRMQQTWKLARMMNDKSEQLLEKFLYQGHQRG